MIPIPPEGAELPELEKGKTVLALYPDSTTFYKAEVTGMDPVTGKVNLRFEGEENSGTLQVVDRRLLDGNDDTTPTPKQPALLPLPTFGNPAGDSSPPPIGPLPRRTTSRRVADWNSLEKSLVSRKTATFVRELVHSRSGGDEKQPFTPAIFSLPSLVSTDQ
ncbi:hypothetical protein VTK73DRAFT_497 [Phialemonium thermophilum]|uniref:SGF29 C-terminal domain-containing protein n=1 Tax=Phialemonium thermophilum TaxID=223376 RepID=A0ABR3VUV2_9PEZI